MAFHGFVNYSQMANEWFLMDSNAFWMISGTSDISPNLVPLHFFYVTMLQKIQDNYGNILKHIVFSYRIIWKFQNFQDSWHYRTSKNVELISMCSIPNGRLLEILEIWKVEHQHYEKSEVWKHKRIRLPQTCFSKSIDFVINNVGILIRPNR